MKQTIRDKFLSHLNIINKGIEAMEDESEEASILVIESLKRGNKVLLYGNGGNSKNVINALKLEKKLGCKTLCLSGHDRGVMNEVSDINLVVPSNNTSGIQEMHILFAKLLIMK
ncbi:MAG: hypothetical protein ACNI3H_15155 [Halarcobacter ebronensis]|uniref:hypothetical protein n=1 Tax=Halarcobacter ebronensis TaxID=1462615 RepID=UPI003C71951D